MITKQYSVRLKEELHMVLVDNSDACDNAIKLRTDILNTNASLMSIKNIITISLNLFLPDAFPAKCHDKEHGGG